MDRPNVERITVFPQHVWKFKTDLNCVDLAKRCERLYYDKRNWIADQKSNAGAWQSDVDLFKEGRGFEDVRDEIVQGILGSITWGQ